MRRIILLSVLGLAGLVIGVLAITAKPSSYTADTLDSAVTAALSDYEANASGSENVYQQQVVNGWVAKDLLAVIARQNTTLINAQVEAVSQQSRTNLLLQGVVALLVLLVGSVAVLGAVQSRPRQPAPTQDETSPAADPSSGNVESAPEKLA